MMTDLAPNNNDGAPKDDEDEKQQQDSSSFPPSFPHIPIGHPDTMMSKESVRRAVEEFQVRPTDVIVATFAKTGTTLVTWMAHQLRAGGTKDLSFDTIYDVVPWPLLSWDIGVDPNNVEANNKYQPRLFKSHLRLASIYRGCKYVVTIRDPAKVALSFYNFLRAKQVPLALEMDVDTFVTQTPFVQGRPGYRASLWDYYAEYHALRDCPSVLVLVYEDLVKDIPTGLQQLARFMNVPYNASLIQTVASMCTKEYMAQHNAKFDEPYERAKALGRAGDLSQLAPGNKVAVQDHPQQLSQETLAFLDEQWRHTMQPLGYDNYQAFAKTFRDINQKRYKTS